MAGSLADFKYLDDNGNPWLVRIDKSNGLASGTGFVALTQADLTLNFLPRNLELRYVNCRHPTRPITRVIFCQSTSSPLWLGTTTTIQLTDYQDRSLQAFKVGKRVAENQKYRANLIDSYQNDSP
jgi:hypothetical protein